MEVAYTSYAARKQSKVQEQVHIWMAHFFHSNVENWSLVITIILLVLLLPVGQLVIKVKGVITFYMGEIDIAYPFSFNKWNNHLRTVFCIFLCCLILHFSMRILHLYLWQICKNRETPEGNCFFMALYFLSN